MNRTVDISSFRNGVFDLFDAVVEHLGDRIVVERRGYDARAVLTSERYLQDLEQQVEVLKSVLLQLQATSAAASFRLIGSAQLNVDPDEILQRSRTRQAGLVERKRAAWRE